MEGDRIRTATRGEETEAAIIQIEVTQGHAVKTSRWQLSDMSLWPVITEYDKVRCCILLYLIKT